MKMTTFNGTPVTIITHGGKRWLTAEQIGRCLGYAEANARIGISNLYSRNADEFTEADTCVINLITQVQARDTRIFSETGCNLLGFFASTPRAKEFRKWAKQVLAQEVSGAPYMPARATRFKGRPDITRQVEFDVLTLFVHGRSHSEIGKQLGISKATVSTLVHAKHRFPFDAGTDLTTAALIEAVVQRHMSNERARLVKKYCSGASNQRLTNSLDEAGTRMVMGHAPQVRVAA